jgi:uncharacterized protein YbbK (DUF523 family)
MKPAKPRIGISRCLLGDAVRYDGKSKANRIILDELDQLFEFIPVCPEVEAGLGIPRPPVQLSDSIENPRLRGRDNPSIDVTQQIQVYCELKPQQLSDLDGFIFKSRSPSCGLNSAPIFIDGRQVTDNSRGVFARAMCSRYPTLTVIEETDLEDEAQLRRFIAEVSA